MFRTQQDTLRSLLTTAARRTAAARDLIETANAAIHTSLGEPPDVETVDAARATLAEAVRILGEADRLTGEARASGHTAARRALDRLGQARAEVARALEKLGDGGPSFVRHHLLDAEGFVSKAETEIRRA